LKKRNKKKIPNIVAKSNLQLILEKSRGIKKQPTKEDIHFEEFIKSSL